MFLVRDSIRESQSQTAKTHRVYEQCGMCSRFATECHRIHDKCFQKCDLNLCQDDVALTMGSFATQDDERGIS